MADAQPSTQANSYCTDDNINAMICQIVNESAATESTLVSPTIDTVSEDRIQSLDATDQPKMDTPTAASGFQRFKKRIRKGLKNLCCVSNSSDE